MDMKVPPINASAHAVHEAKDHTKDKHKKDDGKKDEKKSSPEDIIDVKDGEKNEKKKFKPYRDSLLKGNLDIDC